MKKEATNTSTVIDYFTIDGLEKKLGQTADYWPTVLLKELIDNALDATEPLPDKQICIQYDSSSQTLTITDNGPGIPEQALDGGIYDFEKYHSSNRYFITPSRGKQGVGLKAVICICHLCGYRLFWLTAEGNTVQYSIDDSGKVHGLIKTAKQVIGPADQKGVTITGCDFSKLKGHLIAITREYSECNPDANITLRYDGAEKKYSATAPAVDRSGNTAIGFYTLETWRDYLTRPTQNRNQTYKNIVKSLFGTALANKTEIKGKLKDIDIGSSSFEQDFLKIRDSQTHKKYTALKKHAIGLQHSFTADDINTGVPYLVEFTLERQKEGVNVLGCTCYVNNSITYSDSKSICCRWAEYQIGSRKPKSAYDLYGLLEDMKYKWTFHFIAPQLVFTDTGKTEIDITGIIDKLCDELGKAISAEQKQHRKTAGKRISRRDVMRYYLPDAYNAASSHGRYCITVRQIFYKLRELSGIKDSDTAYNDFTQNIVTEWLEANPDADAKVYFSDRGNFYIGSSQYGLGTGAVKAVIDSDGTAPNLFDMYGGWNNSVFLKPDFDLRYRYDKALYIEKTGFDGILKAERIGERYNMIIVSGQGFGTRAAKTLLYFLQEQGLQLFCMHDLDYSGVNIINALQEPNEKFTKPLYITDLGVTLEDVRKYGIEPEEVDIGEEYSKIDQSRYTAEQQRFFFMGRHTVKRVELNAFTTEQLLQIIDSKLAAIDNLPRVRLTQAVSINPRKIKETALMNVLRNKYEYLIDELPEPDIAAYDTRMTVSQIEQQTQGIIDRILSDLEGAAAEKLKKMI